MQTLQIKTKEEASKINREDAFNIIHEALKESPWGSYGTINEKKVDFIIKMFLDHPNPMSGLFLSLDDNNKIIGVLAGIVTENVMGSACQELMWYVVSDYRKGGVGLELIQKYEEWSKSLGVRFCSMSHYENDTGNTVSKIFDKKGFKPIEHTYVKELK